MSDHYMQRLIPGTPVTGDTPDADPWFGRTYRTVEEVGYLASEIREEIDFDGVLTDANGDVHLTANGERVALVCMDGHHADSRLQVLDPR